MGLKPNFESKLQPQLSPKWTEGMKIWKQVLKTGPKVSDTYKEWLEKNLAGTLVPGPIIPHEIVDVESEHQIRLHRFQEKFQENEIAHLRQHRQDALTIQKLQDELKKAKEELGDARRCLMGLDDRMERQVLVLDSLGYDDRARLAGTHLVMDCYFIWPEVDRAKRARMDAGPSGA